MKIVVLLSVISVVSHAIYGEYHDKVQKEVPVLIDPSFDNVAQLMRYNPRILLEYLIRCYKEYQQELNAQPERKKKLARAISILYRYNKMFQRVTKRQVLADFYCGDE